MSSSLNISLPDSLKDYVENQVKEGGYSDPSEYIQTLVRDDRKRKAEESIETLLLEGLNSGDPIEATPEFWEEKRRRVIELHTKPVRPAASLSF
jgi:antitoxin ParD1/3/4